MSIFRSKTSVFVRDYAGYDAAYWPCCTRPGMHIHKPAVTQTTPEMIQNGIRHASCFAVLLSLCRDNPRYEGTGMIPIHELLSRIHWDPEFGRGEFRIGYHDNVLGELVYVPLAEIRQEAGDHFCFEVTDEVGVVHSVPYHRVKELWKDDKLLWQRTH
jgi:uncharacterized protein (UPF0248 family)